MSKKIVLDEDLICKEYKDGFSMETISKKYHVGRVRIKGILDKNGIKARTPNEPRIKRKFKVADFNIKKYPEEEGYHYIAKSKSDGTEFADVDNKGGHLTTYIKKEFGIKTPTLYDRRIYYQTTGDYWWEQWFDIIKVKDAEVKKCPYCNWTTEDVENKSGAFQNHLNEIHNISPEEHLKNHPEDSKYFKTVTRKLNKLKILEEGGYVICPICNKKMEKLSASHIEYKHGLKYYDFKKKYPNIPIISDRSFHQVSKLHEIGNLHISKNRFVSSYEKELQNFLTENKVKFSPNRQILIGKEIDILVEDKKVGIEFDGLKFHTEWFGKKSHNYHLDKTLRCNEKGYGLIHIFEDEYVNHKDVVLSKIKHILGIEDKNKPKAYGRMCEIKEITMNESKDFLDKYHIQGFVGSTLYVGAYCNNVLVAVMCFKNNGREIELTRFATNYNYNCCGLGGKMFKWFIKKYSPYKIVSFADRRWTVDIYNNLYTNLGFEIENIGKPDYYYYNVSVDRYKRFHKFGFRKETLHKKYGLPLTMTETEMAKELGYDRIWNCGLVKYVWINNG